MNTKMSARMNVNVTTKRALGRKLSGPSTRRIVTQAKIKPEAPVSEQAFRQNLGYTEKDSAGQSNIFAVEPRVYMQGSGENTALVFGVTFIGFAAAFGLGYTLFTENSENVDPDLTYLLESGETLSSYEKKFAPPKPAPVMKMVAVEAPVVEAAPAAEEAPVAVEVPAPAPAAE